MQEFIRKVLNKFALDITDKIFLLIQNDHELMGEYLTLISNKKSAENTAHGLNSQIGRAVREKFNLDNCGNSNKPKSTLIEDYKKHKIKNTH